MTSTIKVNNIQNQCGANIINESSNTITIGASGDTVSLASGASQSGFGRSGSVDWQTTPKTATFTAVNGEGYFINSGSAITMNLPAGSAGAIVAVSDYARNFATYNLTISPNGSDKIGGNSGDATLNVNGQAATFVYVDSTKGWVNVQNAEDTETGSEFITATGGTITTVCTNFKVHTFTGPGTFCVSAGSGALAIVDYEVVGGGGGSGVAGGGAGGYRAAKTGSNGTYTASPLSNPVGIQLTPGAFPITVGGGGTGSPAPGTNGSDGSNSVFSTITSAGGGGGGVYNPSGCNGAGSNGGSGGGGGAISPPSNTEPGGTGNTPPVSPPQGTNGGLGSYDGPTHTGGGGGGGATAVGGNAPGGGSPTSSSGGGLGGAGATNNISGSPVARSGGGGGGVNTSGSTGPFAGGTGGGGAGKSPGSSPRCGVAGTANTGGGAGGASPMSYTATGGSGIVIIRYKFQ